MKKCKIITIDVDTPYFKTTNFFNSDKCQQKEDYIKRHNIVNNFITTNNSCDNIVFEKFDAVTPNDFELINNEENILFEKKIFKNEIFLHGKEKLIANFLSHYKIWQLDEDSLIIEDDLDFNDFNEKLINIDNIINEFNSLKTIDTILYMQLSCPWNVGKPNKSFSYEKDLSQNLSTSKNNDYSGTAIYFLNKETKKNILKNIKTVLPTDQVLINFMHNKILNIVIPKTNNHMVLLNKETL